MDQVIKWLKNNITVIILSSIVKISFVMSSFGWRHIESTESVRVLVASTILLIMYVLIVFELVSRNLAAMIGAAMSVAAYDCLIEFVDMMEIIQWVDLETLSLLFGMMIIASVLSSSGVFDFLAIWSYMKSDGQFWMLISIMSIVTSVLSAFIDNVSTMLLMSPVLIKLSELEHIDPRYMLMIMAVVSNIGGCATPVGDPPNLIIIGDDLVKSIGITFGSFVVYCAPCVIICIAFTLLYMRLIYKTKDRLRINVETSEQIFSVEEGSSNCRRAISINSASNDDISKDQILDELRLLVSFRRQLDEFGSKLTSDSLELSRYIEKQESHLKSAIEQLNRNRDSPSQESCIEDRRGSRLTDMEIVELIRNHPIRSKQILIRSLTVLVVAVLFFFIQSLPNTRLTLGWISLFAGLSLLLSISSVKAPKDGDKYSFEAVINTVEWSTLIFFFSLFIVMEVMAKLGLILFIGQQITNLIDLIPAGQTRSIGAITILLWSSGIASACIDNVPFTTMMVKVLGTMIVQARASIGGGDDLGAKSLVFALAFGASLGGNGTLIGATANLVTASISARHGYPISFNGFFKFAAPITILTLVISNIYLVIVFVFLGL